VGIDPIRPDFSEVIDYNVVFERVNSSNENIVKVYILEGRSPLFGNESSVVFFRGVLNGNYLASYGGFLSYIVESDPDDSSGMLCEMSSFLLIFTIIVPADIKPFVGPDIILEGSEIPPSTKSMRLFHYGLDLLNENHCLKKSVRIVEANFVIESPNGGLVAATRDQLMIILSGLKSIYIRAAYWKITRESR